MTRRRIPFSMETVKDLIKKSPLYPIIYPFSSRILAWKANRDSARFANQLKVLHEKNPLFYTLSPMLLVAIVKAFDLQRSSFSKYGQDLLKGHAYYEFGVFKGFSFWFAEQVSREYTGADFFFYGFDSFEGLPESQVDSDLNWDEGNYAASFDFVMAKLKQHGTQFSRTKIYKGFFSKSLFDNLRQSENFLPCSICVIDSDIYESCVEVLDFIKDYLVPGSILLFDDYNAFQGDDNHGERRALKEFEQKHPTFKKEKIFDFGWHGVAFRVLMV